MASMKAQAFVILLGVVLYLMKGDTNVTYEKKQTFVKAVQDVAPLSAVIGDTYNFGRYREPIKELFHVNQPINWLFKFKRWQYMSFTTDEYFLAFAIAQLNYASKSFVYIVPRKNLEDKYEWASTRPFGVGVSVPSNSISGCGKTSNFFGGDALRFCYDETKRSWNVHIDARLANKDGKEIDLKAAITADAIEAFSLLFPLHDKRPGYTHKEAAMPSRGKISFDSKVHEFENGLATLDWTYSMPLRTTIWNWTSLSAHATLKTSSGKTKTVAVGINLSSDIYEIDGIGMENVMWVDGKLHPLGDAYYTLPSKDPVSEPWSMETTDGDGYEAPIVKLHFIPKGATVERLNLLVVNSDFVQPHGHYTGTVTFKNGDVITIDTVGVAETHHSLW
eukprot:Colp12_sorted_trinity150504_noHs@27294